MSSSDNPTLLPVSCWFLRGRERAPAGSPVARKKTRWSLVRRAQGDGREANRALDELFRVYEGDVLDFIRTKFPRIPSAYAPEDLKQAFLADVVEGRLIRLADEEKGSFRAWFRKRAYFFMLRQKEYWNAKCRRELDTAPLEFEVGFSVTPEVELDHVIARAIAREVMRRHRSEHAGDLEFFDRVSRFLPDPDMNLADQGRVARELGKSASKLSIKLGKLRARHEEILRELVADSLDLDPEDPSSAPLIDAELAFHYRALRHREYAPDGRVFLTGTGDD